MLEQLIKFHEEMQRLQTQGVPLDWEKVATTLVNTLRQMTVQTPQGTPVVTEEG